MELFGSLIGIVLIVVPLWRIFDRTGRSGAWSLLAVVPVVGYAAAGLIWGYGSWPKYESGGSGPGPGSAARPPVGQPPPGAPGL